VQFREGMDKPTFLGDKRTQSAVVMSLVIMDEASTKVMDRHAEFAQRHAEIPWRSMRGMRNRIAHGYFEIDLELVWDTVQTALPALLAQLKATREDALAHANSDPSLPSLD
jgi:uncharacterized protein with HEPN domain